MSINVDSQFVEDLSVHAFNLPVRARSIGGRTEFSHFQQTTNLLEEFAIEVFALIAENFLGTAHSTNKLLNKRTSYSFCGLIRKGLQLYPLCELIHNYQDVFVVLS